MAGRPTDNEAFWMLALPLWDEWVRQDDQCQAGWDAFDDGRYRKAYDLAIEILQTDNEFRPAISLACCCLLSLEKPNDAVPVAERLVSLAPTDWRSHIVRAWALVGSNQRRKATDSARFALELEPDNIDVVVAAGRVLALASPRGGQAEQAAIRAADLDPDSAGAHEIRGDLNWVRGNWSGAIEAYKQALVKAPDTERLLGKLAQMQLAWFSRHDAYLTYRRLLDLNPRTRWVIEPEKNLGDNLGCGDAYLLMVGAVVSMIWAAALEPVALVGSCLAVVLLLTVIAPVRRWLYKRIAPKAMARATVSTSQSARNPDVVAGAVAASWLLVLFLIALT